MKFKNLKAMMLLLALGTFASCQDNLLESGYDGIQLDENGMATITLNVTTEDVLATRAGEHSTDYATDPTQSYISAGKKVNRLIYAVYKQKDNTEEYELQEYFATKADGTEADIQGSASPAGGAVKAGTGQMVVDNFEAGKTTCIKLMLDPEATYKVVCWAQDKDCSAYETSNLEKVKVKYNTVDNTVAAEATTTYYNNDENRDAFCGSSKSFKGDSKETIKIVLRRPFAQINVGTTGADYANIAEKTPGGGYYKYSKMEFTNLADKFNVLTNVASQSDDIKGKTVTFAWAVFPAWIKVENFSASQEEPTAYSGAFGSNNDKTFSGSGWVWADNEEFLKVNLDEDATKILDYLPEYPTLDANGGYLTETFKYMSMSYVLVPSATGSGTPDAETPEADNNELKHGTTIGVKVYFNTQNSDQSTDASRAVFSLNNVPAARNWRTNILGGFHKGGNPGDDDDPSSIFNPTYIHVVVATNYFGNSTTTTATWNEENQNPNWKNENNEYSPEDDDVKDDCQNQQHNESENSPAASRSKE